MLVIGDINNKVIIGYTWYPTASMMTKKYLLADSAKHKLRVHQLDFIGEFIKSKVKHIFL